MQDGRLTRREDIAQYAAAYSGYDTQSRGHDGIDTELQRFLRSTDGENPQTRGVEQLDWIAETLE